MEQSRLDPIRMEQPRMDRIEQPRTLVPAEPESDLAPSLPAFITGPVRINGNAEAEMPKPATSASPEAAAPEANGETGRFPLRRRRRTRAAFNPADGETVGGEAAPAKPGTGETSTGD
jgi:hypothetical protein